MKKTTILTILVMVILTMLSVNLNARSNFLAKDGNGIAIQFAKSFSTECDTTVTGTAADSIAVPANAIMCTMWAKDNIIYWRHGGTPWKAATSWDQMPAAMQVTIPVNKNTYIVYKALTGTAKIYFIWHKL